MFRGIHKLNLDSKGRMAIPTKYRETLEAQCDSQLVVTADPDMCLVIYPLDEWEVVEQTLKNLPSLNKETRALKRLYLGYATDVDMDSQGRFILTQMLREHASLNKSTVLTGQGNKFELWDEKTWTSNRAGWIEVAADLKNIEQTSPLASITL